MEKKNRKTLILSVIICLLPMILGSILYNKLPEQMPVHFTTNDVIDNYAHQASLGMRNVAEGMGHRKCFGVCSLKAI